MSILISFIVAMDRRGLVGTSEGLPWTLPADLKRFRALTMGKPIIMGRTTHEMIGMPLDGRANIVLTRNPSYTSEGCILVSSFAEALREAENHVEETNEVMIIGGSQIYCEALPLMHRLYLTVIEGEFTGNTYFPIDAIQNRRWKIHQHDSVEADGRNPHPHQFLIADVDDAGDPLPIQLTAKD